MLKIKNIQIYFHDTLIIQYEIVEMMYKTSIAVMLVIGFALSFATSNAYASGWDKDPWYAIPMNKKVNKSNTEPYDVRQSHEKGWHNSKVCGVDLCSEKTATEASTFKGLDAGGAKTSKKGAFDGKFYMKGNFIFRK